MGETDVVLTPGVGNNGAVAVTVAGLPLLNQSWFDARLWGADGVAGTSGRWLFFTRILSPRHVEEPSYTASAVMLGIDTLKERAMQLGRAWTRPPLQPQHAYISRSIVRQVGYSLDQAMGRPVLLRVDVFDFAKQLGLIPGEGYADPTEADVQNLLGVLEPDSFPPSFWQQNQTVRVNVSRAPTLPLGANYTALVHDLLYSNETYQLFPSGTPLSQPRTIRQWLQLWDLLSPPQFHVTPEELEYALDNVPPQLQSVVLQALSNGTFSISNAELLRLSLPYIVNASRSDSNFTIADVLDDPDGKWPVALGSIVLLENEQLVQLVQGSVYSLLNANITAIDLRPLIGNASGQGNIPTTIPLPYPVSVRQLLLLSGAVNASELSATYAEVDASVGALNGTSQSLLSVVNYASRVDAYLDDLDTMNAALIEFTNTIGVQIGLDYPAAVTTPIATVLTLTQYIRYFLDNIFYSVVVLMVGLGVLLIFSLLLHDVDAKVRKQAHTSHAHIIIILLGPKRKGEDTTLALARRSLLSLLPLL